MGGYADKYDGDYYMRGVQTGKSLYENYRWMPQQTIPMCQAIVAHLGVKKDQTVLDFGCARGYTVRAFREMGYIAFGYDISEWAVANADESIKHHLTRYQEVAAAIKPDWIIAKDVLEHIDDLCQVVELLKVARKGILAVVPLAHGTHWDTYDVPDYEKDVTHVHRRPLSWWVNIFHQPGWSVEGRYRIKGIKDNYAQFPTGNGFITCRRIER